MRHLTLIFFMGCFSFFLFNSCGSSKDVAEAENSTEVNLPFQGEEYQTNEKFFRATQSGESSDLSTAKKIAMQNTREQLASNVQSAVKALIDNYVQQQDINEKEELRQKFEDLSRTVVREKLSNVRVKDEKAMQDNEDGSYRYFVALEMSKDAYLNGFSDRISEEEELKLEYDKQQFEDTLEEEMKKLEGDREQGSQ